MQVPTNKTLKFIDIKNQVQPDEFIRKNKVVANKKKKKRRQRAKEEATTSSVGNVIQWLKRDPRPEFGVHEPPQPAKPIIKITLKVARVNAQTDGSGGSVSACDARGCGFESPNGLLFFLIFFFHRQPSGF